MRPLIVLIECSGSDGRPGLRERITLGDDRRSFTVGRSLLADVVIDDPAVAAIHASIEVTADGQLLATDFGSINGIVVGGKRQHGATGLELAGNVLQIGGTTLRVRSTFDPLAAELPVAPGAVSWLLSPAWIAGNGAALFAAQLIYGTWVGAPSDLTESMATSFAISALVIIAWVAFWTFLSRVMRGEWRWLRHAAIILAVCTISTGLDGILDIVRFAFSLPSWRYQEWWLGGITLGAALFLHLVCASTATVRRAALAACMIPLLAVGASMFFWERSMARAVNYTGDATQIYPPGFRLRPAIDVETYFTSTGILRQRADAKLKAAKVDDPEGEAGDSDD